MIFFVTQLIRTRIFISELIFSISRAQFCCSHFFLICILHKYNRFVCLCFIFILCFHFFHSIVGNPRPLHSTLYRSTPKTNARVNPTPQAAARGRGGGRECKVSMSRLNTGGTPAVSGNSAKSLSHNTPSHTCTLTYADCDRKHAWSTPTWPHGLPRVGALNSPRTVYSRRWFVYE